MAKVNVLLLLLVINVGLVVVGAHTVGHPTGHQPLPGGGNGGLRGPQPPAESGGHRCI